MEKFLKDYWFEVLGAVLVPVCVIYFGIPLKRLWLSPLFIPMLTIEYFNLPGPVIVLLLLIAGFALFSWYRIIFDLIRKTFAKNLRLVSRMKVIGLTLLNVFFLSFLWGIANLTATAGALS